MRVICRWCGKVLEPKPPLSDNSITHTICGVCHPGVVADIHRIAREAGKEFERVKHTNHLSDISEEE